MSQTGDLLRVQLTRANRLCRRMCAGLSEVLCLMRTCSMYSCIIRILMYNRTLHPQNASFKFNSSSFRKGTSGASWRAFRNIASPWDEYLHNNKTHRHARKKDVQSSFKEHRRMVGRLIAFHRYKMIFPAHKVSSVFI